jgi:hypothetical protein
MESLCPFTHRYQNARQFAVYLHIISCCCFSFDNTPSLQRKPYHPLVSISGDTTRFTCTTCNFLPPTTYSILDPDYCWAGAIICKTCQKFSAAWWFFKNGRICNGVMALSRHGAGITHKRNITEYMAAKRCSQGSEDDDSQNLVPEHASQASVQEISHHEEDMLEDLAQFDGDDSECIDVDQQGSLSNIPEELPETDSPNGPQKADRFQCINDQCDVPVSFLLLFPYI